MEYNFSQIMRIISIKRTEIFSITTQEKSQVEFTGQYKINRATSHRMARWADVYNVGCFNCGLPVLTRFYFIKESQNHF